MLLTFILSCFKSGSPFKSIAITIVATLLFSTAGVIAYKLYTSSAKIDKLTTQVAKVTQAATQLTTTVKDTAASIVVNDTAETVQAAVATKATQQHVARQVATKKRIAAIVSNKTLPVAVEEEDLSNVYITSIWSEYCASAVVDNPSCKTTATTVTPDATLPTVVNPTTDVTDSPVAVAPAAPEPAVTDLNTSTDKDLP